VSGNDVNASQKEASWWLDHYKYLTQDSDVSKRENTVDDRNTSKTTVDKNKEESIRAAEATSASNAAEKQQLKISSKPILYTVLSLSALAGMALITSVKQIKGESALP
jgi:predicted dinucleotide-utilizing enzyme